MGKKQSIYEKPGSLEYYKFSAEEYALIKNVWSGIEVNPQFHGNAYLRSFCEMYPQYVKFFTLEPTLPVNFDARTTAKFSIIMESLGHLLLDFNKKPKRLDRFVGYIAMVHKDMRLEEQDMRNVVVWLLEYLLKTYPTQMTAQCQEAISKFMDSMIKELSIKMEIFRGYDVAKPDVTIQIKSPWGRCPMFAEPLIFGKTKLYWDDWKKEWDARWDEWMTISGGLDASFSLPMNNDNTLHMTRSRADLDEDDEVIALQRKALLLMHKRQMSDVSAARLALLNRSKTADENSSDGTRKDVSQRHNSRQNDKRYPEDPQRDRLVRPPRNSAKDAPRERRRARNTRGNPSRRNNAAILRRCLRNKDHSTFNETIPEEDNEEMSQQLEVTVKSRNTARKRHRERFSIDLE